MTHVGDADGARAVCGMSSDETPSRFVASQEAMRISPLAVSIAVLAALSGWFVRGIQLNAEASPMPQPVVKMAMSQPSEAMVPLRVERPADLSSAVRSTRNLFAYREREIPAVQPAVFHPAPAIVAAPVMTPQPQVEERPRLRFTPRYIGKFGPENCPIAAFARDGKIVTVRVGDRIDDHFVLRAVGMESVEIEASVDGEVQVERVALGANLR